MGSMGGMGGGAPAQGQAADAAPAEEKAEPAKEKTHFDIELTKFDAATKIKLIKEVRGMFGLGLKEAKEMVEGAPVWLKKEVKKEEADEIAEKLKAVGGEVRLAWEQEWNRLKAIHVCASLLIKNIHTPLLYSAI